MPTHLNYKDKSKNVNVTKRLEAVRSCKWSGRERVMHATMMMMKMRNTENTEETYHALWVQRYTESFSILSRDNPEDKIQSGY